jgi:hypothetical protein
MPITRSQKMSSQRPRSSFHRPAKQSLDTVRLERKLLRMARLSTKAIFVSYNIASTPIASSGFVGRLQRRSRDCWTLKQLVDRMWFRYIRWDGKYVPRLNFNILVLIASRTTLPVVDRKTNKIIAVLAGRPSEKDWPAVCKSLADILEHERSNLSEAGASPSRRGAFVAKQTGYSHGGGRTQPSAFNNNQCTESVLSRLRRETGFVRLADFMARKLAP